MAKLESGTRIYGNVTIDTFVTATGNVTGGNLLTAGLFSATANVTGGNILTAGLISATGNITVGNISAVGGIVGLINPRTITTTSNAALTPNIAVYDQYNYTALAANLTINAPTGSPVDGNKILFRIIDNGTSRTLTWNATYTVIGVTLPTATTANKMVYVGCVYNSTNTRWDTIAVSTQA
jgi:hypothetical protein